jgi:hypothetical protein
MLGIQQQITLYRTILRSSIYHSLPACCRNSTQSVRGGAKDIGTWQTKVHGPRRINLGSDQHHVTISKKIGRYTTSYWFTTPRMYSSPCTPDTTVGCSILIHQLISEEFLFSWWFFQSYMESRFTSRPAPVSLFCRFSDRSAYEM